MTLPSWAWMNPSLTVKVQTFPSALTDQSLATAGTSSLPPPPPTIATWNMRWNFRSSPSVSKGSNLPLPMLVTSRLTCPPVFSAMAAGSVAAGTAVAAAALLAPELAGAAAGAAGSAGAAALPPQATMAVRLIANPKTTSSLTLRIRCNPISRTSLQSSLMLRAYQSNYHRFVRHAGLKTGYRRAVKPGLRNNITMQK